MEHVVFYPSAEGAPAFRRFGSLEDAVRFVEHLRNVEGVAEFSLYALTPVALAMRAYYRVEPVVEEPVVEEPVPVELVAEEPVAVEAVVEQPVAVAQPEPVVAEAVAEVAEPVADFVQLQPVQPAPEPAVPVQAVEAEALASPAEPVLPSAEPSANGRRGLGFFSR